MGLAKQELAYSSMPFTAQDAGEAEQHDTGLLLPANRAWFNGFRQKGKQREERGFRGSESNAPAFPLLP